MQSHLIYGKAILNDSSFPQSILDKHSTPPFEAPWHAQVFAVTHKMAHAGHFSWADWAQRFAEALEQTRRAGGATDGSDYYDVWLQTLEELVVDLGVASPIELSDLMGAWKRAYLTTPHGQPVELPSS